MTSRDWEKELAMIDRQLASLSDEALQGAAGPPADVTPERRAPSAGAGPSVAPSLPGAAVAPANRTAARRWVLYVRLAAVMAVSVGILFWPYGTRCGAPLAGYLAGVGVIALGGVWTAVWSWRHRAAIAHVISLLVLLWGLGLASWQLLPRVGLAIPTIERPALWACN